MSKEANNEGRNTWFYVLALIALVGLIAKLMGRSEEEEQEERTRRSREEQYKKAEPSYPDYQYNDWADSLENALKEGLAEDEDAVYAVFQRMRNTSDVLKLIEAYGHRRTYFSGRTGIKWRSLPETIKQFFNASEINHVNDILKSKGINYRF